MPRILSAEEWAESARKDEEERKKLHEKYKNTKFLPENLTVEDVLGPKSIFIEPHKNPTKLKNKSTKLLGFEGGFSEPKKKSSKHSLLEVLTEPHKDNFINKCGKKDRASAHFSSAFSLGITSRKSMFEKYKKNIDEGDTKDLKSCLVSYDKVMK